MNTADFDITATIGPIDSMADCPMYSFDRPASILWNAIARELAIAGWSEKMIQRWLQSKATRWALDSDLGDALDALGKQYGKTVRNAGPR